MTVGIFFTVKIFEWKKSAVSLSSLHSLEARLLKPSTFTMTHKQTPESVPINTQSTKINIYRIKNITNTD